MATTSNDCAPSHSTAGSTSPMALAADADSAPPQLTDMVQSTEESESAVPPSTRKLGKRPEIESLDYDIDASTIFESNYAVKGETERRLNLAAKWLVCGVAGLGTGAVAFVLDSTRRPRFLFRSSLQCAPPLAHHSTARALSRGLGVCCCRVRTRSLVDLGAGRQV